MAYVDRISIYSPETERVIPTIKSWNNPLLRERERKQIKAGGFEKGYVLERVNNDDQTVSLDCCSKDKRLKRKGKKKMCLEKTKRGKGKEKIDESEDESKDETEDESLEEEDESEDELLSAMKETAQSKVMEVRVYFS